MSNSIRLNHITVLRSIAITLVVFFHCICIYTTNWCMLGEPKTVCWQPVADIFYAIHMPLFTLISGYLYIHIRKQGRYNSWRTFLKKKCLRILVPLVIWGIFECIIDLDNDFSQLLNGPLHLWFLRFIMEAFIITRIFDKHFINNRVTIIFLFIAVFGASRCFHTSQACHLYYLLTYYPYFVLGLILREFEQTYYLSQLKFRDLFIYTIASFFFLILAYITCRFMVPYISVIFLASLLYTLVHAPIPSSLPNWCYSYDKCSMGIYLMHHPIIWNIAKYPDSREFMYSHPVTAPIVLFILVTALTWLLSYTINKNRYLKIILG